MSPKSAGFISEPRLSAQNVLVIHPTVVEVIHFEPKWLTDQTMGETAQRP